MPKQVIPEHKKGDMRSGKRVIYMRIIYFLLFIYTIRTRLRQKNCVCDILRMILQ